MWKRGQNKMDAEHINPVYKATNQVFNNMFQSEVKKGNLKVKKDIIPTGDINASIGVSGELNGTILFSFPREMALKIVEEMAGMEIEKLDKFVASAIGELANIISGNAVTNYSEKSYECDIVSPQVNIGKNKTYSTASENTLIIPLQTDFGEFKLNISIDTV